MTYESGWLEWLKVELRATVILFFFSDACFAADKYIQVAKVCGGYIAEDAKEINDLVSRIRIRIEARKFST